MTRDAIDSRIGKLGGRILSERRCRQWSQRELGRRSGMRHDRISRLELGLSLPSLEEAMRLAEVFEVSLDELARGGRARDEREGETTQARIAELERHQLLLLRVLLVHMGAPAERNDLEESAE